MVAGEMMEVQSKEEGTRKEQAKMGAVVKHEWGQLEAAMVEGVANMPAPQDRKQVIAERLVEAGFYSKGAVQAMGSAADFFGALEPVKAKVKVGEAAAIYGWAMTQVTAAVEVPREAHMGGEMAEGDKGAKVMQQEINRREAKERAGEMLAALPQMPQAAVTTRKVMGETLERVEEVAAAHYPRGSTFLKTLGAALSGGRFTLSAEEAGDLEEDEADKALRRYLMGPVPEAVKETIRVRQRGGYSNKMNGLQQLAYVAQVYGGTGERRTPEVMLRELRQMKRAAAMEDVQRFVEEFKARVHQLQMAGVCVP